MKYKVCHLTTVHSAFDDRIFHKECKSLLSANYNVFIIGRSQKDCTKEGIKVFSLPSPRNRLDRFLRLGLLLYKKAIKINADIYHFHDPELIFVGLILKLKGKKVIYDVHENYSQKILDKEWIPRLLRPFLSKIFSFIEKSLSKIFDAVICADSYTAQHFKKKGCKNVIVIANYPLIFHFNIEGKYNKEKFRSKNNTTKLIYIGAITKDRGFFEMLEAMKLIKNNNVKLLLLGKLEKEKYKDYIQETKNVEYLGFVPFSEVPFYLSQADIGLALFRPVPSYIYASENTIKIFEYMLFELPIITSNFPGLKKIVEENKCGLCVDPTDLQEIVSAIEYLVKNKEIAREFGKNGRLCVEKKYNWKKEGKKLIDLYRRILK
jgi:glycosyltransferase involved in cell wall biosynthesis